MQMTERTGAEYSYVTYEVLDEGRIARIMMNRPRQRNAQNRGLLVELDDAFMRAERDDDVRVVILGGIGPMFSSGHDLGSSDDRAERSGGPAGHPTYLFNGGSRQGTEQRMLQEWHYYFENARRWRNLKKITIAETHGPVLAAGLMIAWTCDLIVATPTTTFADVVGTRIGMCGVEYFAHPWELGPRRAKELLLTGDSLDAHTAHQWGMVSRIFPDDELQKRTMELAQRIAGLPTVTALLIKEAVNQSVDNMGFYNALNACFSLHQINHAHWAEVTGGESHLGTPEFGVPRWQDAGPILPRPMSEA
ncbi:enoyl-CoA hydratase [Mycolicibacterium thermoresistibile]|uniref:Enoyl-CoA hydratase n=2 Tax=Mycolicibacterium thermoresistibile TaxID=1797 RepID=G7CKG6_MYCT3|nr:enoyl-CoA hydratase [Mycolicibacterium thermoresistibile ATCC 19527]GAT16036.1 enoyl-CoA hydratase/isomerase [Mycolicibacterium thermoresistibile]